MKRASIDIGSNSVLLLGVEINEATQVIISEFLNESYITSLGRDLDATKKFHPDSMQATYEALKNYKGLLDNHKYPIDEVIVTATEASRVATNAPEFFKKIKNELGFNIQTITSDGEAYYTALGVLSSLEKSKEKIVVMDIGGASTELILIETMPFKIIKSVSFPVGSVRATDWIKNNEFDSRMEAILSSDTNDYITSTLVCVAGSMTALASMYLGQREYSDKKIDGMDISFQSFLEFSKDLKNTNVENLLMLFPFLGKRAPMVAAGSTVAAMIGHKLKIEKIKISTRGLRYGVVLTGGIDEQYRGK